MRKILHTVLPILLILVLVGGANATTEYITAGATVNSVSPDNNLDGVGSWVVAVWPDGETRETYIKLPSTASTVYLNLYIEPSDEGHTVNIYNTGSFDEDTITWNNRPTDTSFLTSFTIPDYLIWYNITLTNPSQYLHLQSAGGYWYFEYSSDDTPWSNQRPYIVYTPPPSNPIPAIISWSNDKTNNAAINVTFNPSNFVKFNATANQTITAWIWYKDDVNQNWNYDNFTTSFTAGNHTIMVNATNSNGTSNTITWNIISLTTFDSSGYVYFLDVDNTTNPIPEAFVYINDTLNATTDSSGYYSIPNVPNGVYTLYVSHPDFTTDSKTISNAAPINDFVLKFIRGLRFAQLTDVHIGPDPSSCSWGNSESEDCMSLLQTSIDRFNIVRDNIIAKKPDFVLITGDLVEWNSAYQYSVFITNISKFKENNIDVYMVPGNHDRRGKEHPQNVLEALCPESLWYDCFNNLDNYRNYIGSNDSSGVYKYEDGDYFEAKNGYRFIGLDSGYDASSSLSPTGSGLSTRQIDFVNNSILDGKTIIFMHHPAMDDDNFYNVISENRDQFINLTYDKNVKLVLTGHTHRSKFLDSNGRINVNLRINVTIPEDINTFFRIIEPPFPSRSPLFIQTRSATKGDYTLPGYLIVNIEGKSVLKERISLEDVRINGSNITPVTILYLNSPADLHVYDESGRHTGLNAKGGIENGIPDSYYFEEYKFGNTTLPAFARLYNTTLNYTYKIVSNFSRENITADQAMFNFTIKQKIRGAITTIKYNNVSINRKSIAYIQINMTQTDYTMKIDLNNDSIIDTTKQPDTIVTDYAPTATIISPAHGSIWNQGQAVTFNGSGIDREDGTLNKLTWVSDRDDVIGHGNFTTANLSAGVHNIILLVNDSESQVNTANIVVTVRDTVPPFLNIEYPPENKIFNRQNITIRGFAYDDSGILNVTLNGLQAGKENWNVILSLNEGQNIINVTATDNKGFITTANRTVYYNNSLASDTEPPATITNLTHKTGYDNANRAWINWTWDNPKDIDFSYVRIYLDNIRMENTSRSYFNITGLSSSANYSITIQSADVVDNINLTGVKDTVRTAAKDPPPATPEAIIKLDASSKDFKVYNSETGAEASFVELPLKLRRYTLRYGAGNTLSLVLKYKKAANGVEISIISMQYNGGAVIEAAKNTASVEYSEKKGMLKEIKQKIEVKKLFDAGAKYSAKKGETEIKIKNEGQKEQKQTRAGIAMLELLTDNGSLKLRY